MATITMAAPLMLTGPTKYGGGGTPSASLTLLTSSKPPFKTSLSSSNLSCGPLRSSFFSNTTSSSSFCSSFSGLSLGLDLTSNVGVGGGRSQRLVVRAGKAALCQTKRNRSRKSLARTHGFRARMSTTSGRAILKRRRAKGRQILCTKSNPNSGKRS